MAEWADPRLVPKAVDEVELVLSFQTEGAKLPVADVVLLMQCMFCALLVQEVFIVETMKLLQILFHHVNK